MGSSGRFNRRGLRHADGVVLGLLGMMDMLELSATTSLLACAINGTAGILFIRAGMVAWPYALVTTAGSLSGGYGAPGSPEKSGKLPFGVSSSSSVSRSR